jgi:hypothetical protein
MEKIDQILHSRLTKKKLSGTLQAAQICFYVSQWGKTPCQAISFTKGILRVSVDSSPAASELEIQKEDLISFINEKLGRNSVRLVKISIKW